MSQLSDEEFLKIHRLVREALGEVITKIPDNYDTRLALFSSLMTITCQVGVEHMNWTPEMIVGMAETVARRIREQHKKPKPRLTLV